MNKIYKDSEALNCISCKKEVDIDRFGIVYGTAFSAQGNFGSSFDPMGSSRNESNFLSLVLCNDCTTTSEDVKLVTRTKIVEEHIKAIPATEYFNSGLS